MEYAELFALRIKRRIARTDKAAVADELGISVSALNDYLAGRSLPRVDIAIKLANRCGLGDHLQWLFGDTSDSVEPPSSQHASLEREKVADSPTYVLMDIIGKRYWPVAVQLHDDFEWYKNADWIKIGRAAISLAQGVSVSEGDQAELDRLRLFRKRLMEADRFSIKQSAWEWEAGANPLSTRPFDSPEEYEKQTLDLWDDETLRDIPVLVEQILFELPIATRDPLKGNRDYCYKHVEEAVQRIEKEIEEITASKKNDPPTDTAQIDT